MHLSGQIRVVFIPFFQYPNFFFRFEENKVKHRYKACLSLFISEVERNFFSSYISFRLNSILLSFHRLKGFVWSFGLVTTIAISIHLTFTVVNTKIIRMENFYCKHKRHVHQYHISEPSSCNNTHSNFFFCIIDE